LGLIVAVALSAPSTASAASLHEQLCCGEETVVSQVFPSEPSYTVQAADDFTVPAGETWSLTEVVSAWFGEEYDLEEPPTNNVFIYADTGSGVPGPQLFAQTGDTTAPEVLNEVLGIFKWEIPISGAPTLDPGTYWISLQASGSKSLNGTWYWGEVAPGRGSPAVLRNPGDGYGSGCTAWTERSVCVSSSVGEPDQSFALRGSATSTDPPVPPPPAEPPNPPAPSNAIEIDGKATPGKATGTATLEVSVPGPGVLTASGAGLKKARVQVTKAGKVKLKLKLNAAGKKKLRKSKQRKVKVKVKVTFTPTGGQPRTVTKAVVFKGKPKG
jgi:hypothetical protein